MSSDKGTIDQNEVVVKHLQDGYVATEPIQTLEQKRLQKRLLLKTDILLIGMISLIMLVNQWVVTKFCQEMVYF